MGVCHLHPYQQRILAALGSATRILQAPESSTIIGSLGRRLAGHGQSVGDIDVKVDGQLCERYWDFVEILVAHGLKPVFDILDRPRFPWDHCYPILAHGLALTVDCGTHARGVKYANLDIAMDSSSLSTVPNSERWVYWLDPNALRNISDTDRLRLIEADHQKQVRSMGESEKRFANRKYSDELGMYFGW